MVCQGVHSFPKARVSMWTLLIFPDVINVSGHRLSTAEIESALILHPGVAETAGSSHSICSWSYSELISPL
jgi:hypothetical protein